MHQIIDAKQSLMMGKNRWEHGLDDGTPDLGSGGTLVEEMQEQEVDLIRLRRRRRTRNAAAGAIAGMMATRRAVQETGAIGTNDLAS